jgi:hypothetical protein
MVGYLLERETLNAEEIDKIIKGEALDPFVKIKEEKKPEEPKSGDDKPNSASAAKKDELEPVKIKGDIISEKV